MAFRHIIGLALAAAVAVGTSGVVAAQQAGAQLTPPNEQQLLKKVEQNPQDILALVDLVRLYVEEGRLVEADEMLRRTALAIQRARGLEPTATFEGREPLRIGGDIGAPTKIRDVRPAYPQEAKAAGVQGIVILEVIIDPMGDVADAHVIKSVPMLDEPALEAVRQWRFTPTLLNGEPVPVVMTVTVNFRLN
jgi:TonB family protein